MSQIMQKKWYSLLCVILGVLLGLLLAWAYSCQKPKPITLTGQETKTIDEARYQVLEEEIARLEELLKKDPCEVAKYLGMPAVATKPEAIENQETKPTAEPTSLNQLIEQATVFVLVQGKNDEVGSGSGFFVTPNVVATNKHVVQLAADSGRILVGNKFLGGMRPARLIAMSNDDTKDFALLQIENAKAIFLKLGAPVQRTEKISAWGYPALITGADPKLKNLLLEGDISSAPDVVYSEGVVAVVLERNPPFVVHTATIYEGNSGGPLVNQQGQVVGINTAGIRRADSTVIQSGIALSVTDLSSFMDTWNIKQ